MKIQKPPQNVLAHFSGPIPPPEVLSSYNKIDPNLVNRIVSMAEEQSKHRRDLELSDQKEKIRSSKRKDLVINISQFLAFFLTLAFIAMGGTVAILGSSKTGFLFGSLGIASVIISFLYGHEKQKVEKNKQIN